MNRALMLISLQIVSVLVKKEYSSYIFVEPYLIQDYQYLGRVIHLVKKN
jgi:hypothetical protein